MEEKNLEKELAKIKEELEELKKKLSETQSQSLLKTAKGISQELVDKIANLASDIGKSAIEIADLSFQVLKGAVQGALEGAKEAIKTREQKEKEKEKEEKKEEK